MKLNDQNQPGGRTKVGEKIRLKRLEKNYSQENMAWELNISQAAYSKLERDETEITLQRVYDIADILKIPASDLLPKSKYGSGINQNFLMRITGKLSNFWQQLKNRNKKPATAIPENAHSDISNNPEK